MGRFGPDGEFRNAYLGFLDAEMHADGRWVIIVGRLSAFVKTAHVPNCPQLHADPYICLAHASVRPAKPTEFSLFCGVAIALDVQSLGTALAEGRAGNGLLDAW